MKEETMEQWNALKFEFDQKREKLMFTHGDERAKMMKGQREKRLALDEESRKFHQQMRMKREELTIKCMEERRLMNERHRTERRVLEQERQAAYTEFKVAHADENDEA